MLTLTLSSIASYVSTLRIVVHVESIRINFSHALMIFMSSLR